MTWLVFLYVFTLGAEQSDMLVGYDPSNRWYGYTEFEASVLLFDTLEIGGSSTIRMSPSHPPFFNPIEGEFIFFVQLIYKMITIGAETACYHNFQGYYTRDVMGYTRFYLQIGNRESQAKK